MSAARKKGWLSRQDLKEFRQTLLEKRAQLVGDVSLLEDQALRSTEEDVSVDHMADHGSDSFEQDQTIGLIERENEVLRDIQDALRKIKAGGFGVCEECDGRIKKARLRALPYARLCLDCQMAAEQA
ncbi:MAG: TraR/DksA family transcriptional regulator [Planctomycetota bacterium]|jgi:RNA polymerase-binding protein DksA